MKTDFIAQQDVNAERLRDPANQGGRIGLEVPD
jgi:hypothetical protein